MKIVYDYMKGRQGMIQNIDSVKFYTVHLMSCALHNIKPREKPEDISWESLLKFAEFHSVTGIVYLGIGMLDNIPEDNLLKWWKEKYDRTVVKETLQDVELNRLSMVFENNKIPFLPLKGSILSKMYPKRGMRSRADIDILIKEDDAEKVHSIMLNGGYSSELYEDCHHDTYFKKPVLNVEIHRGILPETMESCCAYYKDIWDRLKGDINNPFYYHMTDEEFYIFQIVHLYKHYIDRGSGIRSIMDIYVLNSRMSGKWNKELINTTLKKLGLLEFENKIREISYEWFDQEINDDPDAEDSDYILSSGTYGLDYRRIEKEIDKRGGRIGYFMYRIFLPYSELKCKYEILEKLPFLLPVFWLWRFITALFSKRSTIKYQLKVVFRNNKVESR